MEPIFQNVRTHQLSNCLENHFCFSDCVLGLFYHLDGPGGAVPSSVLAEPSGSL